MKEMMKMLEKKKKDGKEIDPIYKDSKMSVLQELRDQMAGMMKDDLHGAKMKKVEVASNDKQGLAAGLDKAKDMLSGHEADEGESPEEGSYEEEKEETHDHPVEEMEAIAESASSEDLDAMIKKLEEMKQKKSTMV